MKNEDIKSEWVDAEIKPEPEGEFIHKFYLKKEIEESKEKNKSLWQKIFRK